VSLFEYHFPARHYTTFTRTGQEPKLSAGAQATPLATATDFHAVARLQARVWHLPGLDVI